MGRGHESYRLGRWIRRLRERAGITQRELALRIGITPSALSRLESEERETSSAMVRKIAEALGVHSLAGFFFEVERGENPVHRLDERVTVLGPDGPVKVTYLGPRNRNFSLYWMLVEMQPGYEALPSAEEDDASILVIEGKLGINIDGEEHVVNPGELCFIAAHSTHRTHNLHDGVTKFYFAESLHPHDMIGFGKV